MPVNSGLAQLSNELLFSTVILYALAMLCYACDFAFGKQRVLAVASAPELVGAAAAVNAAAPVGAGAAGRLGSRRSDGGRRPYGRGQQAAGLIRP